MPRCFKRYWVLRISLLLGTPCAIIPGLSHAASLGVLNSADLHPHPAPRPVWVHGSTFFCNWLVWFCMNMSYLSYPSLQCSCTMHWSFAMKQCLSLGMFAEKSVLGNCLEAFLSKSKWQRRRWLSIVLKAFHLAFWQRCFCSCVLNLLSSNKLLPAFRLRKPKLWTQSNDFKSRFGSCTCPPSGAKAIASDSSSDSCLVAAVDFCWESVKNLDLESSRFVLTKNAFVRSHKWRTGFIPTWGNDPIWLIFFKWVETTN